jgi:predicted nuclease of restriction endonuclease-like RecB superfamily
VRDPDGEMAVVPKLLHGRAALREIEQAITVVHESLGMPRSEYDGRRLEAVMGDYRLGRCIEACLFTRYSFVQPGFEDVLTAEQAAALKEQGIESASGVRFAVWDEANSAYGGFAPPAERESMLSRLAQRWGLPPDSALVDTLMALDAEGSAVLTLNGQRPEARDVLVQYNRGAVKTLLAHSTRVELALSRLPGAALKRLYFLAKRRGVLVDIEQAANGFMLTLYGPEQAFGTADKYGRRLADVSLDLVRTLLTLPDAEGSDVQATAHLVLHDRDYRFHVTPEIVGRLDYAQEKAETRKGRVAETAAPYSVGASTIPEPDTEPEAPSFDSLVEARLYKEYMSLQRGGYTHGWMLQREPEPLLAPGVVMIPDFGFQRGDTRVFMEIAGFWSPGYRERKVAKLRTLAAHEGYSPMILAVPREAAQAFEGLPFPVVTYKTKVAATDLLNLLNRDYGNREERRVTAEGRLDEVTAQAKSRGFVPESEIAERLQAYSRTELLALAQELGGDGAKYVPGVGLLTEGAIERVRALLAADLAAANGRLDLVEAERAAATALDVERVDVESLLAALQGFTIERPSLFEAYMVEAGSGS